jgi:hypothetical protein
VCGIREGEVEVEGEEEGEGDGGALSFLKKFLVWMHECKAHTLALMYSVCMHAGMNICPSKHMQ